MAMRTKRTRISCAVAIPRTRRTRRAKSLKARRTILPSWGGPGLPLRRDVPATRGNEYELVLQPDSCDVIEPVQSTGEFIHRVLQMNAPPVPWKAPRRRGVQQKRAHDQYFTGFRVTRHDRAATLPFFNAVIIEFALTMRTRNHFQRAIGFIGVIEVDANRDHLFEYFSRRMHVNGSFFD